VWYNLSLLPPDQLAGCNCGHPPAMGGHEDAPACSGEGLGSCKLTDRCAAMPDAICLPVNDTVCSLRGYIVLCSWLSTPFQTAACTKIGMWARLKRRMHAAVFHSDCLLHQSSACCPAWQASLGRPAEQHCSHCLTQLRVALAFVPIVT
jgi:hypothetical protein